jgi:6-phosphogluconolactonase
VTAETPLSRRAFVSAVALGTLGLRAPGGAGARERLAYVGTYTNDGRSEGIYLLRMQSDSGALRLVGAVAATANPSFLAPTPDGRVLYAVSEVAEFEGTPSGAVSAFARDSATGGLVLLDRVPSGGGAPCYAALDRTGRFLLVANYGGGSVAVLPVRADGGLGEASSVVQHEGKGADPKRQSAPHAHCILPDPSNRFVLVTDLGLDRVIAYRFDARDGTLSRAAAAQASLAPGAGPRHLAFHPNGRVVYVVNELDSTLTVLRHDPATGSLAELQTIPTLVERTAGRNAPADVHVHPSGRFLYVSNRGHDSIAAFAVDRATALLRPLQEVPTGGSWPRNFALDPSGRFLLVANQRSDSIVGHRIDTATGLLTPTGQRVELPAPACIRFDGGEARA